METAPSHEEIGVVQSARGTDDCPELKPVNASNPIATRAIVNQVFNFQNVQTSDSD